MSWRTYDLGSAASPCGLLRKQYDRLRLPKATPSNATYATHVVPGPLVYHLAIKPISRSAGRSATAAAAYRAGSLVIDERTGEIHDYTRKSDIEHSEILVPAGSPVWATERVALWNAAEAAEKRKDARVARDYEVAIPKELSREQGIALVRDFAHRLVDAYGVAVDFNVHRDELRNWDGSEKGWQGYHAHLLTSTRKLGRDGFGEKAAIDLSDTKRKSLGLRDGAAEIARVREWWEIDANRHLEQANQAQRIDRRSLKDQGIDREPTVHLGPAVTLLERGGIPSRLGDVNRQVVAEHKASLVQQRHVAAMALEIGKLYAEIVEGREKRSVELAAQPSESLRRSDSGRLDTDDRAVIRQAMANLVRERDLRVQRVAQAQARQQRRDKAYQVLAKAEPAAPKGLLAAFQQKGFRQAHTVWERTTQAAARLVEQAKRLATRLVQAARPDYLAAWALGRLEREQPEVFARYADPLADQKAPSEIQESKERHQAHQARSEVPAASPWRAPAAQAQPELPEQDRSRAEVSAQLPASPGPSVAPPKRDWNRHKLLQQELAKKGRQSLQERGVLRTDKDDLEIEQPKIKKDRGIQR